MSPVELLFIRHLDLKKRVGYIIFDMINAIGWLKKLMEAKRFPLGKSTDKLGKKKYFSLQSLALRDLPKGFALF